MSAPLARRNLAVLVLVAVATLVAACSTSAPPTKHIVKVTMTPTTTPPSVSGGDVHLNLTGPIDPPNSGALLGAWVNPEGSLTQVTRVTAVDNLQRAIGRKLDIVHTYRRMTDAFPMPSDFQLTQGGATLMVSWATPASKEITSGADDAQLVEWAKRFASFPHPIMLRMRWEMDRPNLTATMGSGADFVAAWKHVRAIFTAQHVTNVSWVWCPTANGFTTGVAPSFYPGDDQVDWTCVDVYAATKLQPLSTLLTPYLTWAAAHPKPIIIGEFGIADAYSPDVRSSWLADAAQEFRANPQIKAVCYFDSDPAGAVPQESFALPTGSAPLTAFRTMAQQSYFNPHQQAVTKN
ncbi:MAG TPA: endoglucanase [Micromonosporaceae bacterium]